MLITTLAIELKHCTDGWAEWRGCNNKPRLILHDLLDTYIVLFAVKFLGLIMERTQLFANQHKIAVNCESNSILYSGLLLHFCAIVTAESVAPSSLPIRPVLVVFQAHYLGRFVAFLAKYPQT